VIENREAYFKITGKRSAGMASFKCDKVVRPFEGSAPPAARGTTCNNIICPPQLSAMPHMARIASQCRRDARVARILFGAAAGLVRSGNPASIARILQPMLPRGLLVPMHVILVTGTNGKLPWVLTTAVLLTVLSNLLGSVYVASYCNVADIVCLPALQQPVSIHSKEQHHRFCY
jgi:hypothetical protein